MERAELIERAGFGKQVEAFWGSRIGQYLEGRAQDLYVEAIDRLRNVDPTDVKAVMNAQNDAWKAESFKSWLSEAVTDGLKSLDLIDQEEAD
jgi:hypothetical protein